MKAKMNGWPPRPAPFGNACARLHRSACSYTYASSQDRPPIEDRCGDLHFPWQKVAGFRADRWPGESTGLDDYESDAAVRPAEFGSPSSPDEIKTGLQETVWA